MTDHRNTFSLLRGEWGEERTGAAEQHMLPFALGDLPHDISAQYHRATSAAGTTRMNILRLQIIDHGAAVIVNAANTHAVPAEQIQ